MTQNDLIYTYLYKPNAVYMQTLAVNWQQTKFSRKRWHSTASAVHLFSIFQVGLNVFHKAYKYHINIHSTLNLNILFCFIFDQVCVRFKRRADQQPPSVVTMTRTTSSSSTSGVTSRSRDSLMTTSPSSFSVDQDDVALPLSQEVSSSLDVTAVVNDVGETAETFQVVADTTAAGANYDEIPKVLWNYNNLNRWPDLPRLLLSLTTLHLKL